MKRIEFYKIIKIRLVNFQKLFLGSSLIRNKLRWALEMTLVVSHNLHRLDLSVKSMAKFLQKKSNTNKLLINFIDHFYTGISVFKTAAIYFF